jgi:hypothetical protein
MYLEADSNTRALCVGAQRTREEININLTLPEYPTI